MVLKMQVTIDGEYSEAGKVGEGETRMSIVTIKYLSRACQRIREVVLEDLEEGTKLGGRWIKALRLADD